jgi:hypothetical protein
VRHSWQACALVATNLLTNEKKKPRHGGRGFLVPHVQGRTSVGNVGDLPPLSHNALEEHATLTFSMVNTAEASARRSHQERLIG